MKKEVLKIREISKEADNAKEQSFYNKGFSSAYSDTGILKKRVDGLEAENAKLREHILLRDSIEKSMDQEFRTQLSQKDEAVRVIVQKHANPAEIDALNKKISDLESLNAKLREHILLRDSVERAVNQQFKEQLGKKDETINRLMKQQSSSVNDNLVSVGKEMGSEIDMLRNEIHALRQESEHIKHKFREKQSELSSMSQYYREKERAYDDIQLQLSSQLKERVVEIERLKAFIAEREELSQRTEEQLLKELAGKDSELRVLRHVKSVGKSEHIERQLEHAVQVIKIKEAAAKKLGMELIKLKEADAILQRDMNNERANSEELESKYKKVLLITKKDNETIVHDLITEYSLKQASDRAEIEKLKSQLSERESQLQMHKQKIDSTIKEFNIMSQQMLGLRGQAGYAEGVAAPSDSKSLQAQTRQTISEEAEDRLQMKSSSEFEEYTKKARVIREAINRRHIELSKKDAEINQKGEGLALKESEIKGMLNTVEQKLKDLEKQEESIRLREKLLLKQQEAFNRELDALENASRQFKSAESRLEMRIMPAVQLQQEQAQPKQKEAEPAHTEPVPAYNKEQRKSVQPAKEDVAHDSEHTILAKPIQQKEVSPAEVNKLLKETPINKTNPKLISKYKEPAKTAVQPESKKVPEQKTEQKKEVEMLNLKEQTLGYPEVEEIISIIDVAMQNKDTVERIRKSLASSGYSKENIDKALAKMKLA